VNTPCKLCEKKRARRYCPGVGGDICPVCCGTEREVTIDCPSDCQYLQEARLREAPVQIASEDLPNRDVRLSEKFLREQEPVMVWLAHALADAMEKQRAVDADVREALDSLIRTYRTLESGLIYETRPHNPYAASLQEALKQAVDELRKRLTESSGMYSLRDADVLGVLVFFERLSLSHNNGRPRGRAFYDFMRAAFANRETPSLVV
jgi:hypothetical protein